MVDETPVNGHDPIPPAEPGIELDAPETTEPETTAAEPLPTDLSPEQRLDNLERIVRMQSQQIQTLQQVLRKVVSDRAVEVMRPAFEAQVRQQADAELQQLFAVG